MKEGWELKKLGEVCEFLNGLWTGKKAPFIEVGVIRNTNFTKEGKIDLSDMVSLLVEKKQYEKRKLQYGDIILEKSGGGPKQPVGRVVIFEKKNGDYSFSNFTSVIRIENKDLLDFHFLHKFLYHKYISGETEKMQSHSTGIRNLKFDEYKEIQIPIPPLPEQQHIVAILDQAFAAIDAAKANMQRNLQNAKDLFQSELNRIFTQKGNGWVEKKLGEVIEIRNGKNQQQVISPNGKYPIYGSAGNLMGYATDFICEEGTTIIGRKGNIDRPLFIDHKFWNVDTAFGFHARNELNKKFLFYFCLGFNFGVLNRGTTIPSLVKTELLNIVISFPNDLQLQQQIVQQLDILSTHTKTLEKNYQQKIFNLEELKKSILHKAFSGALTQKEIAVPA